MQNQKLFDKIRASLGDEEALEQEPLEWSKEHVWQKIEQRQHRKRKPVWWPFAAAAALAAVIGGYIWFLAVAEVEKSVATYAPLLEKQKAIPTEPIAEAKREIADFQTTPKGKKREAIPGKVRESKDTFITADQPLALVDVKNTSTQDSVLPMAIAQEVQSVAEK